MAWHRENADLAQIWTGSSYWVQDHACQALWAILSWSSVGGLSKNTCFSGYFRPDVEQRLLRVREDVFYDYFYISSPMELFSGQKTQR